MIIQRLETNNFRALKQVDLECDSLVALLGRNGAGKSSVLHALEVFYNVSAQINEYDYFDKAVDSEITIRVSYGDLRGDEVTEFAPYLADNQLIVTKVINSGGSRYYAASRQLPEFVEMRKQSANPKRQAFNALVDSAKYPDLNQRITSAGAADEAMAAFESAHPELIQVFQKETQFFGPKNIGGGKLDKYTKYVLIPAVRDASSETDRRGAILQLIDVLVMRSVNARPDVQALNAEFERRVKEVYNTENLTELRALGTLITEILRKYAPGAELDLRFDEITPPKLALPQTIASLTEDNFSCPISYSGHGLQRALIFALLQQLSITETAPAADTTPAQEPATLAQPTRIPDLILAIEEPELYLHPARCRYLSNVMFQLSRPPAQPADPRTQILYGTHSPYFVDLQRYDQIRLARKVPTDNTSTLQTKITSFSRALAARELARITQRPEREFTALTFAARALPVMTTIVNEGFFADVAVVVEGLSDVSALWTIQDLLSLSWDALGIAVVPVVGKNNIDRPVVVFRGLGIPTYFIFDGDSRYRGTREEAPATTRNRLYLRLAASQEQDFPVTAVVDNWAVFENDLETELKSVLGDADFDRLRETVAGQLGYDQPSAVLKNPDGMSQFIRASYNAGHTIPVLEDIARRITSLRQQQ